ncbi:phospholipase D family protein [Lysobacter sp. CCNWLW3]|uniref:phospholipase D family protein n=1 Tax=unclassified Lysobacter TaxID=2635362 RepID=UPI002FD24A06
MKVIHDQQHVVEWIRGLNGPLDIAIAFWGAGAMKTLGLAKRSPKPRILLELDTGGSNPSEVERLWKTLGKDHVRCLPRLHAKAVIASNEVLIGSANASASGLGTEGHEASHWHELALLTHDTSAVAEAQEWFSQKWEASVPIDEQRLANARIQWKRNRENRPYTIAKNNGLLSSAISHPNEFLEREIYVVTVVSGLDEKGTRALQEHRKRFGPEVYAFQRWPTIPTNAVLICFTDYPDEGLCADTPMVFHTGASRMKGAMQWVYPAPTDRLVDGFKVEPFRDWRSRLELYRERYRKAWDKNGMSKRLVDFVRHTGPA